MDAKLSPGLEDAREQVDRILASDTFRTSEVLRRLLRFLADKTFSGEADQLKEYSVGLDALGKPPTFDTRQDAGVRLQASRLRQRLDEYYRNEGLEDPLTVEMPRGRFKIVWTPRGGDAPAVERFPLTSVAATFPRQAGAIVDAGHLKRWRNLAEGLACVSLLLAIVSVWSLSKASRATALNAAIPGSTPELEALWSPLLSSAHHLVIAFSNPIFVRFLRKGGPDIVYRRRGMTEWADAAGSPEFSDLSRSLGNPTAKPSFNFVERSNLVSTFALGQFFARRRGEISLARLDELSWQQFAENDIVLLATPPQIAERQAAMPVRLAFVTETDGVRDLQPRAGEPAFYKDAQDHQESDGEGLELVSVTPGPLGRTTVLSFSGNHAWGVIGGVQAMMDPAFASVLVQKLRRVSGQIPPYYQVVIKIRYRDGTPTNASYLTHRELSLTQNPVEAQH